MVGRACPARILGARHAVGELVRLQRMVHEGPDGSSFACNMVLMSDGMKSGPLDFQCMSLSVSSETECDRIYNALAAGGTPIGPTFFAKRLAHVADKFSVSWMIMVPGRVFTAHDKEVF